MTSAGADQAKKKKNSTRKSKQHITCFVCSQKGHYARECPERKVKQTSSGVSDASNCALVAASKSSYGEGDNSTTCFSVETVSEQNQALMRADLGEIWITDSGASAHMTFRRDWLSNYRSRNDGSTIALADGRECEVVGEGSVNVERLVNGKWSSAQIQDVLYVPDLGKNLYSVGLCTSKGLEVQFKGLSVNILRQGEVIVTGLKQNNLIYRLFIRTSQAEKHVANAWKALLLSLQLLMFKLINLEIVIQIRDAFQSLSKGIVVLRL